MPFLPDAAEAARRALEAHYLLEDRIGEGALAAVYRAKDLRHQRTVAVKLLQTGSLGEDSRRRFLREIRISSRLTHPNIVPVYDSGEVEGFLYYVMPYVAGRSLKDRLAREGPLPQDETLGILAEVAEALGSAHAQGVVHRDVKPGNILLSGRHAWVADFGLACMLRGDAPQRRLTDTGVVVGTPYYIAPEQASGASAVDARADQYSLACVAYEMLAGHPPFLGPDVRTVLARHLMDDPPPLRSVRPDTPLTVARPIRKALAKVPADRFPDMAAFLAALRANDDDPFHTTGRSLAVLPFENLGPAGDDDYLADGFTEEVLHSVACLDGVRVVSRTTSFALKGCREDARVLGERLHVSTLLGGTVRRQGSRLRVTVQLVGTSDGCQLWSDRYDRLMEDVFQIQEEIARHVARSLKAVFGGRSLTSPSHRPADVRAYEFHLRGRQFLQQTRKRSLRFAQDMFERAIQVDPGYALAHAGLAETLAVLHMYYPREGNLAAADLASQRAVELAPDLAQAHAARGLVLWRMGRMEEAHAAFDRARQGDPHQHQACYYQARACFEQGRMADAARLFAEACKHREDHQSCFFGAQSEAALGHEGRAAESYRRALRSVARHMELNPDDARAATMRAVSLCRLGHRKAGLEWAEQALELDPEDPGIRYNVACLFALEDQPERALDNLEEALQEGFADGHWIARDPDLASLREHPRFRLLLDRMGEQQQPA